MWLACVIWVTCAMQDEAPSSKPAAAPTREAQALALVRDLEAASKHAFWYARSTYRRAGAEVEPLSARWIPQIPIDCGNSIGGTCGEKTAAAWAQRLAKIYGVELRADVAIEVAEPPGRVVFEVADPVRLLGLKLRGRSALGTFVTAGPAEEPETELDADEARALAGQGWRIHAVDVADLPLMDADEFTPLLSYLVGVSEFLNAACDGEDLALSGLLFARTAFHRVPDPQHVSGGRAQLHRRPDGALDLHSSERSIVRFQFPAATAAFALLPPARNASAEQLAAWEKAAKALATERTSSAPRGASALCFDVYRTTAPAESGSLDQRIPSPFARLRLLQRDATGELRSCESTSPRLFVPAAFDLAQPFEVELELEPAAYVFSDAVRLGFAEVKG